MTVSLVPGSPEWKTTITASRVGAIMGASTYDSPTSIWHQLAGLIESEPSPPSDPQFRGTWMEPYVLAYAWQRRHPDWEQHAGETTWTREDLSFPAAANTDSHGVTADGHPVIVEAKTVGWQSNLDEWGEEGTDQVPLAYYWQVVFQMLMTGIGEVRVERCGPGVDEHREYVIRYDPAIGAALQQRLADFYSSVLAGIPPRPDDHEATFVSYKRAHREVDDSEWEISAKAAADLIAAKSAVEAAEAEYNRARSEVLRAMGDARFATVDGQRVARRQKAGKGVSLRPMVDELPDQLAA